MQNYLYPTFILDQENFEKALPVAINLSLKLNLNCRYWKNDYGYAIAFEDQAISKGFYYTHKNEERLVSSFEKHVQYKLIYTSNKNFTKGTDLV
ncbi:MAG: hypothetical protein H0Z40_01220 [Desulfotomaculum sp.]|nr:hypothetical protein [Desulfotomaculum sp.]